jgi:hypothetical protein
MTVTPCYQVQVVTNVSDKSPSSVFRVDFYTEGVGKITRRHDPEEHSPGLYMYGVKHPYLKYTDKTRILIKHALSLRPQREQRTACHG